MKKVFRPHIILLIEGRLLMLLFIAGPLLLLGAGLKIGFFSGEIDYLFIPILLFAIVLGALCGFSMHFLWQQIWGKLIIEKDKITWKCLFCRKVQIDTSEIHMIVIRNFGSRNVVKYDMYKTGFQYILISAGPLPSKPIDKIMCRKGLIKWPKNPGVCPALREVVPERFHNVLK